MKTLALVACSGSKLARAAPAGELYTGHLFRKAVAYALARCDRYAILSAKHHFVLPDQVLEPYDLSLSAMNVRERNAWGSHVVFQMRCDHGIYSRDWRLVFLAGSTYVRPILRTPLFAFETYHPLSGMAIGQAMRWLAQQTQEESLNEQLARRQLDGWIEPDNAVLVDDDEGLIDWNPADGANSVSLDGEFDADQLEALIWWMRNKGAH